MQLIKKVTVKQVLTKESKAKLHDEFKMNKLQLERECEQLLFEQRKLIHQQSNSKHEITRRFQQAIEDRKDKINLIEFKIEQLALLDLGSEVIEREVDAIVEVSLGSKWSEINGPTSIVIKDDIVIRMDNR